MKKEFAFLVIALLCIISFSAYYCQQGLSEEKGNQITATVTGKEHVIGYEKDLSPSKKNHIDILIT